MRGRFEFEAALHELCNHATSPYQDSAQKIFDRLGATVDLKYEDMLFRTICKGENGYDVRLPADYERFLDVMEAEVPGCRQNVKNYIDLIGDIDGAQDYMDANGINPAAMMLKYGDFLRAASRSNNEVMTACGIPPKAQSILNTYWGYLGVPTDDLCALHYISLLTSYAEVKPTMPHKRSHELSLSLVNAFMKHGGEVRYNSEVTRFLFDKKKRAVGVLVGDQEFRAKKIVSNIMPHNVINRSDSKSIPHRFKKLANARKMGMSFSTIYLGLDCSAPELGIKDYSVFISKNNSARVQFNERLNLGYYVVNCLNVTLPKCTPKGTSTLFFTIPFMPGDLPADLTPRAYKEYKNALAERFIKDYEKVLGVSVMPHIEEISVATPITFARYLGTPEGAIYGYQSEGWDNIVGRIALEKMDYNIPNLYFCGGHHVRGDGFPSGYITGDRTARQVIRDLKEGK